MERRERGVAVTFSLTRAFFLVVMTLCCVFVALSSERGVEAYSRAHVTA